MTRIYGQTIDMRITGGPSDYTSARAGTGGLLSANAEDIRCGQSPSGVYVYRGYAAFDTSVLGATTSVTSVSMGLKIQQDNSNVDFVVQIWDYDWKTVPNGTGTGDNRQVVFQLVSAGSLSGRAATIETAAGASQSTAGKSAGSWMNFTALSQGWVSVTGSTRYVMRSKEDTDASPPSGDEWVKFYSADDANINNRPYLDVEFTSGGVPGGSRRTVRIYASGVLTPVAFTELG